MEGVITSNYLVHHMRKGKNYMVVASDRESANAAMQDMHHRNFYSLPDTFLYERRDGDWELVSWLAYELKDGRPKTIKKK